MKERPRKSIPVHNASHLNSPWGDCIDVASDRSSGCLCNTNVWELNNVALGYLQFIPFHTLRTVHVSVWRSSDNP